MATTLPRSNPSPLPTPSYPPTRTLFSNTNRIIISLLSLPNDPSAPAAAKISTYLLDSQGRTTGTLGLTTTVNLPISVRSRSRSSSEESSEDVSVESESATTTTDADSSTITPTPLTSAQTTSLTSTPSITPAPFIPSNTIGLTPQVTSPSNNTTTRTVAIGVAGGVVAFLVAGLIYFLVRRFRRRRARRLGSAGTRAKGASRRGHEESQAEKDQASPVTIAGFGRPGDNDVARTTTLSAAQRPQGHEGQAQRRIPSGEDLARVNPIPEQWLREREIHSPLPRPPSRTWRGFPDYESDYTGIPAATEDYSTNAGEGSVDGYWHETASMREERLYRLQRPGHSPPLPPSPRPSAPVNEPPQTSQVNRLPLIREDRVAGMSLLGDNAAQANNEAATMPSPTTGEGDTTKQNSSGMESNMPLLKNDTQPGQSSAPPQ